jgi:hypothetical protein
MNRDFWVDISTIVVGIAAIAAFAFSAWAATAERRRVEQSWRRQVALDHHARIYEAAASLLQRTSSWAALAQSRIQARGKAEVDYGYVGDAADESVPGDYAELLDRLGASRAAIDASLSAAIRA